MPNPEIDVARCRREQTDCLAEIKQDGPQPGLLLWLVDWVAEEILVEGRRNGD